MTFNLIYGDICVLILYYYGTGITDLDMLPHAEFSDTALS